MSALRVLVVTEYYPRAGDPARGVWAHRQAMAARDAGAEVEVLVLHRPVPPLAAIRRADLTAARRELTQPADAELDGIAVRYVRYLSPPRPLAYSAWGAFAAPALTRAIAATRRRFPFDLVHAHYAVPAGDAVRRAAPRVPWVVSVHGHDVYGVPNGLLGTARRRLVGTVLGAARTVLANSAGTAQRCRDRGAHEVRVVHLGTDLPADPRDPAISSPSGQGAATLVTVANLVRRKRHADVIEAVALLRERTAPGTGPALRWIVVGDGPERPALEALARARGVSDAVEFRGALPPSEALAAGRGGDLFVLPSVDEAFGVAYIEAMAGGIPAIGCRGEPGPEEIARCGGGIELVAPGDPAALAAAIAGILAAPGRRAAMSVQASRTVAEHFTWERCGRETLAAYRAALLP